MLLLKVILRTNYELHRLKGFLTGKRKNNEHMTLKSLHLFVSKSTSLCQITTSYSHKHNEMN